MNAHLAPDRLAADLLDEAERAHVETCVRCRAERRVREARTARLPRIGPYQVLGAIGSGGMARVYAARDPRTGEARAIKVMQMATPGARARFAREARVQRRVTHPNVLALLDLVRHGDQPALVLPLVEGPNLAGLLKALRPPLDQRLALFREVVVGVAAIHAAGLVHRDLKPANVLIDVRGVRVADFGVARASDDETLTGTGGAVGTPAYMAPEQQLDASRVDARADVYALGRILGDLVAGEDPALDALATRMRAQAREDRPDDADAVLAALPSTPPLDPALLAACRDLAPEPELPRTLDHLDPDAPRNLPAERDSFVGRGIELDGIAAALDDGARLVTLLGPAGVGKTRLVVHFGWRHLDEWPGGVWFCDLTEARDADGIVRAVAAGLEVPLGRDGAVTQLGHAIAGRRQCLVVLDNFEQVAQEAANTVGRWLDRAPEARFLVTSRERLGLVGERTFDVDPLVPSEAEELFRRRAEAVRREVSADPSEVAELVRLLDRLPLAIELAAARVRVLTPARMLARLADRFGLLVSDRRDRHATLRAALDWSWELLGADEQAALARLAVFEGGFDLDAAEAVLGPRAVDRVEALVHRSLVRAVGEDRFDLLVSVQAYASERLREQGGEDDARERHARHFATYGTDAALLGYGRTTGVLRVRQLLGDLDNVLAAWRFARVFDPVVAVALARAGAAGFERTGPYRAAADIAESALPLASSPGDRAALHHRAGVARRLSGDLVEGARHFEAALAVANQDDPREPALRLALAVVRFEQGRAQDGTIEADRSLALAIASGDHDTEAAAAVTLGTRAWERAEIAAATELYGRALRLSRDAGLAMVEEAALHGLAMVTLEHGRPEDAVRCAGERLELIRLHPDGRAQCDGLVLLGTALERLGRTEDARRTFEESVAVAQRFGDRRSEATGTAALASLNMGDGHLVVAERQFREALAVDIELGFVRQQAITTGNYANVLARLGRLQEAEQWHRSALSVHRRLGHRQFESLVLSNLAESLRFVGRLDEAAEAAGAALDLARQIGSAWHEGIALEVGCAVALVDGRPTDALALATGFDANPSVLYSPLARARRGLVEQALGASGEGRRRIEAALADLAGDRWNQAIVRTELAVVQVDTGDPEAVRSAEYAVTVLREIGDVPELGRALCALAAARRDPARLAEARVLLEQMGAGPRSDLGRALAWAAPRTG